MSHGLSSRTLDSMQLFGPDGIDDAAEQKVAELTAEIKSLSRDNQVLKKKLQKMQSAKGGVMKVHSLSINDHLRSIATTTGWTLLIFAEYFFYRSFDGVHSKSISINTLTQNND